MPPERTHPLAAAAARKSKSTLELARGALRDLEARGEAISFQAVARRAGISRQWLYGQPEIRAEIERLRVIQRDPPASVPAAERSTEASLRQRLHTVLDENRRLREETAQLKHELALAYGVSLSRCPRRR